MERKVIFQEGMDNDPADYKNLQDFAQKSIDNIVADALTAVQRYAGFTTSRNGPTAISVTPGRLYSAGQVYARNEAYTKDFVTALPVAGKKIAALVIWGTEIDTDNRPREFLINEETGASEPRVVSMERARIANINVVLGEEAPDPATPLVDVGLTVVAHIVLTPTGIDSITMFEANRVPYLEGVNGRVAELEDFRTKAEPRISTIATDISKLANQMTGTTDKGLTLRIAADVARLKEKAGLPDNRIDYGSDHFLDKDETDVAHPNLLCKIEEGIRFSAEAEGLSQLQVFDALNPRHVVSGGVLLPAYDPTVRLSVGPRASEQSLAQYPYQVHEMRQLTMSRQRIRYGEDFTVCTNSAWWQSGNYDPVSGIFTKDGETFQVGQDVNYLGGGSQYHLMMRVRRVFVDTYEEAYWDKVTVDHTVNGAQGSQTALISQDGWLVGINLYFSRLADDGAVTVAITETGTNGLADPKRVIAFVTVPRDQLKLYPQKTFVQLPPTYTGSGSRIGIVLTTGADHWVCMADGGNYAQGTWAISTDGAYQQGDLTKDLMFDLVYAQFRQPRAVIEMQQLQLSGGITAIDILASTVAPASTSLVYEIQVDSVWHPLQAVQKTPLVGLPSLLPLRLVMVGTTDMMPGIVLSGSQVKVSRPRTTFLHVSTPRTLPAGVTSKTMQLKTRLEYFETAYHSSAARLFVGDNYATTVTPLAVSDVVIPEEEAIERTYTFDTGTPVGSYKMEITGTTTTPLKTWHVAERVDISL